MRAALRACVGTNCFSYCQSSINTANLLAFMQLASQLMQLASQLLWGGRAGLLQPGTDVCVCAKVRVELCRTALFMG